MTLWEGQVLPGDRFLLCSDGLSDMLSDEEISEVLESAADSPADSLVRRAKEAGGRDNITVLIICFAHEEETDDRIYL